MIFDIDDMMIETQNESEILWLLKMINKWNYFVRMENGPYWFVLSHVLFKYELIAIFEYFVLQYKLQSPNNPVLNLNALMTFMTYYVLNPLTLVDKFFRIRAV